MIRVAGPLLAALVLTGCATSRDRVILLPDAHGKVGKIAVSGNRGATVLDQPYASAGTDVLGRITTETFDADTVRRTYGAELAGLPLRPAIFQLYFRGNTIQLTPESEAEAPRIYAEIAQRPAAEVLLVGHSDTMGTVAENDALSLLRAMQIRAQLVILGVSGFRIDITAQGEHKPAIPTADNVDEPRNRRVEIQAR